VCVLGIGGGLAFLLPYSSLPPDQCQDISSNKSLPVFSHTITTIAFTVMVFSYIQQDWDASEGSRREFMKQSL
jgi:hypothetical protein